MKPVKPFLIAVCLLPFFGIAQLAWKAQWISPGFAEDFFIRPCPEFIKEFTAGKKIQTATLYITAHGLYEATINKKRVGEAYFTPGWTSYDKRLQYQVYDVASLLQKGSNTIQVTVADGWYRGVFGGDMKNNNYGTDAALLFQLEIRYHDDSNEWIVSDSSWKSSTGPIRYADIYNGEVYDSRITATRLWGVAVKDYSKEILVRTVSEAVKKQEVFHPRGVFTDPKGEQIIDFGQNISGWVKFSATGKAGDTIKLFHAETLDKAGNFFTGNLRQAKATEIYILKGGRETFEPHFTYHGFRYIKVEGSKIIRENFTAIALHTALEHTGTFACSDPLINKLQKNIEWSLNSNFFDIPTDCPQRSERLGWTGDAQVFCRTASFNRNVKNFFAKWLQDLQADQGSNGAVPRIVPDIYDHLNNGPKDGIAGWSAAATIIPWTLYWVYNDTAILRAQYPSMKAWVDYIESVSKDHLWKARGYGDWLAPGEPTYLPFIDQCFWGLSTQLLINTAIVLGKPGDVITYTALLTKIKAAFLKEYISAEGKTISHTQTSYVLALQFDMLPGSLRPAAAKHLVTLIKSNKNHLSTGFLGTPYLLNVLSQYGYTSVAFDLLAQKESPSWLYPVTKGATTIWEKWDAIRTDGSFDTCSLNHYAYGAVGDWLYRVVAGIDAGSPGYKKIILHPHIGGGLTWVKASYKCPYGLIRSEWKITGNHVIIDAEIPKNTTATFYLPGDPNPILLQPGIYHFTTHK